MTIPISIDTLFTFVMTEMKKKKKKISTDAGRRNNKNVSLSDGFHAR